MIFGIIRDGVRSAFVRIVRYIVFAIIVLVIFYIIGIFSNKKVKALTLQTTESQPPMVDSGQFGRKHDGSFGGGNSHYYTTIWWRTNFQSDYVISQDNTYDLVAFKIIRLNYYTYNTIQPTITGNQWNNTQVTTSITLDLSNFYAIADGSYMTVFGYMGTSTHGNVACFTTSEIDNYVFCPIKPGMVINSFWLEIAIDAAPYVAVDIDYEVRSERTYYNYDNHQIVQQQEQIVQQQQQTQQTITDSTTTTSQANATSSLNTISGQFNDVLNGWGGEWSSLTHVVLEPINTILYAFDSGTTCTPITLTIPYLNDGQTITLPCMSSIYGQYFSGFITVFVMIIGGLYGYRTVLYILRTIKEVIDAENDKIEVIDL